MSDTPSVGARLAAARAASGMSVDEVGSSTKLRSVVVAAIENDDFSQCGGDFYARAHVRAIAKVVGEQPDELTAAYDRTQGREPGGAVDESAARSFAPATDLRRARGPRSHWAIAAAVIVLAIGATLLGIHYYGGSDDPSAAPVPGTSSSSGPVTVTAKAGSGVHLAVRAVRGQPHISITASSGSAVFDGELTVGRPQEFADPRSLTVRFADGADVTAGLNGAASAAPCRSGSCTVVYARASTAN